MTRIVAHRLHDLALIPWWGLVEERRGRLLAMLRWAEETADDGPQPLPLALA